MINPFFSFLTSFGSKNLKKFSTVEELVKVTPNTSFAIIFSFIWFCNFVLGSTDLYIHNSLTSLFNLLKPSIKIFLSLLLF